MINSSASLAHELDPNRWEYLGLYKSPLFANWFWAVGTADPEMQRAQELPDALYGYASVRGGYVSWTREGLETWEGVVRRKLADDPAYFASLEDHARRQFEAGVRFATTESSMPLAQWFSEMVRVRLRMQFYWTLGAMAAIFMDTIVAESAAAHGVPLGEVQAHIPKPSTPLLEMEREAAHIRSALEADGSLMLLADQLVEHVADNASLKTQFDAFVRSFDWIQELNWLGDPMTPQEIAALIRVPPTAHEALAIPPAPEQFVRVAQSVGHLAFLRQGGSEYCSLFEMRVRPQMERIARELGVTYRELVRATPAEIMQGETFAQDIPERVARREDDTSAIFTVRDGTARVVDTDIELAGLSDALIPTADTSTNLITGKTAYVGCARGRVRVVIAMQHMPTFEEGEILVAPMTTPDYILLMQKSAAIVTDMGGLLCHAAIVSRELRKPCIIGAKIATQVLKDGDLVEVDAEKGTVRVLERAGNA